MRTPSNRCRKPAVAGRFYPAQPAILRQDVTSHLAAAHTADRSAPKALIAPHAGYPYSGPIAGSAYAPVKNAPQITRVVLIGPSHYVPFDGLAVPSHEAFATPLGEVPVDRAAVNQLLQLPQVAERDDVHAPDHALETHLPFLQATLDTFSIVPLLTGQVSGEAVAEALRLVWGGAATLIAVSSDLSHFFDYDTACTLDQATSDAIVSLRPEAIAENGACGRRAIQGLLHLAHANHLYAERLDLRNSGDTGGDRRRVVGYGAYDFHEH